MNKTSKFDWVILEGMKYFSYFGWGVSSIFSFIGVVAVANLPIYMYIIAAAFAVGVNIVEAGMGRVSFDELAHPKDINGIVTVIFGFFCYVYDIWTNIAGFCFMFTGTANVVMAWNVDKTLLVWPLIFGVLFAIGPEPLFRFYLTHTFPKPMKTALAKPFGKVFTQSHTPNPPTGISPEHLENLRKMFPDRFKR